MYVIFFLCAVFLKVYYILLSEEIAAVLSIQCLFYSYLCFCFYFSLIIYKQLLKEMYCMIYVLGEPNPTGVGLVSRATWTFTQWQIYLPKLTQHPNNRLSLVSNWVVAAYYHPNTNYFVSHLLNSLLRYGLLGALYGCNLFIDING